MTVDRPLVYTLVDNATSELPFVLDYVTGVILKNTEDDLTAGQVYTLWVYAQDEGTNPGPDQHTSRSIPPPVIFLFQNHIFSLYLNCACNVCGKLQSCCVVPNDNGAVYSTLSKFKRV